MSNLSFRALVLTLLFSFSFVSSHNVYAGPENEAAQAEKKMRDYLTLLQTAPVDRFLEELYKLQNTGSTKTDLRGLRNNSDVQGVIRSRLYQISRSFQIPENFWSHKDTLTAENLEDLRFNSNFQSFWYALRSRRMQLAPNATEWLAAAKMQRPRANVEWQDVYEAEKEAAHRFFELNPTSTQAKEFFNQPIRPHFNWVGTHAEYLKNKDGITPHFGRLRKAFLNHPDFEKKALKADSLWPDYGELPHHAYGVATNPSKDPSIRFEALNYLLSRPREEEGNFIKALESLKPAERIEYLKSHASLSKNAWSHAALFDLAPKIAHLIDFKNPNAAEIVKFNSFRADEFQTNKANATDSDAALWDLASKHDFGKHRKSYPVGLVKAEKYIRDSTGKALQLHDAAVLWMSQATYTDADLNDKLDYLNSYTNYGTPSAEEEQRKSELYSKLSDSTLYRFMLNVVHTNENPYLNYFLFHEILSRTQSPEKAEPWLSQLMDAYLKGKANDYAERFSSHIRWSELFKNEKLKEYLLKKYPTLLSEDGPHSLIKIVGDSNLDFKRRGEEIAALRAVRNGTVAAQSAEAKGTPKSHNNAAEPARSTATSSTKIPLAHRLLGAKIGSRLMSCFAKLRGQ